MMKTILRAAAFTMGLVLGLAGVVVMGNSAVAIVAGLGGVSAHKPQFTGSVEVRYLSWEMKEGYPIAKFEIVNGLNRSLTYGAHSEGSPFPTVEVDGERRYFMHCGTGQRDFSIPPGATAVFEVGGYYFDQVKVESLVNVGFYFRSGYWGEAKQYAAEGFQLPADFLAAVGKDH